jgi:hypothetical protein
VNRLKIDVDGWLIPDVPILIRDLDQPGGRVEIGEALAGRVTLFADRAQLERLRDVLTAALDEQDGGR